MNGRKSRRLIAACVAIALGMPVFYAACRAAGNDPVAALVGLVTGGKKAESPAPRPAVPQPPDSELHDSLERPDGARQAYYVSKMPPDEMAEKMKTLMLEKGWQLDETWTRAVGARTEGGTTLIFRANGWQCQLLIGEQGGGSDVAVNLLPVSKLDFGR